MIAPAAQFQVSVDFLIGRTQIEHPADGPANLTAEETQLIADCRSLNPQAQEILRLLIKNHYAKQNNRSAEK